MLRIIILTLLIGSTSFAALGQTDSLVLRKIYDEALMEGEGYENLRQLCKDVGARLSGSENAEKAVNWSYEKMQTYGFDKVWLEPVTVPHWDRGGVDRCAAVGDSIAFDALSLGFSVATDGIIRGEIVSFASLQALTDAESAETEGKIVFLNQPMNAKLIDTFGAYGSCANGRVRGASIAAERGAIAFVMRSAGLRADDFPHTGVMAYADSIPKIPAMALSTNSAYRLSNMLEKNPHLQLELESHCQMYPDKESHNVIAEITGSQFPEKVITVGGHLDSWDVGEGAHDDGAGVIQALEMLRLIKATGIKPKHTIRCVFFMNEENGARGGGAYALASTAKGEKHIAALESDRGGFTPRGFTVDGSRTNLAHIQQWLPLFEPYGINFIKAGYGGVDITPLRETGATLIGFVPDSQRYFDVHHTANDVFENVNERELQLGAAAITSLIYLIDKYGMPAPLKN